MGFELTISAGEQPQTCALDRAAIGSGILCVMQFDVREGAIKRKVSIDVAVAALLCYATAPHSRCNLSYEANYYIYIYIYIYYPTPGLHCFLSSH
jgi:hypothetical protein